jgi:hypothetical protein
MHKLNGHDLIEAMGNALEQRIRDIVDERIKLALGNSISIEDYRDDIETMISEYINYNVTVTLEG